jgi:hypothetical protein
MHCFWRRVLPSGGNTPEQDFSFQFGWEHAAEALAAALTFIRHEQFAVRIIIGGSIAFNCGGSCGSFAAH